MAFMEVLDGGREKGVTGGRRSVGGGFHRGERRGRGRGRPGCAGLGAGAGSQTAAAAGMEGEEGGEAGGGPHLQVRGREGTGGGCAVGPRWAKFGQPVRVSNFLFLKKCK
jgi:hypothetical protein